MRLALPAAAVLAAAALKAGCPEPDAGTWDPCAGLSCGEECASCPPAVAPARCPPVPATSPTACNARGECVAADAFVCTPQECAGKACGVACETSCPKDAPCPAPVVCDGNGACVPRVNGVCPASPACAGKTAGDGCAVDPPCRQSTPPCLMPSIAGACQADGSCMPIATP
jgi:hypothetical protein